MCDTWHLLSLPVQFVCVLNAKTVQFLVHIYHLIIMSLSPTTHKNCSDFISHTYTMHTNTIHTYSLLHFLTYPLHTLFIFTLIVILLNTFLLTNFHCSCYSLTNGFQKLSFCWARLCPQQLLCHPIY